MGMKGKKLSPEHRKKLSIAHTGKIMGSRPLEVKEKIRRSNLGQKRSVETIKNISIAHIGLISSPEMREKCRIASTIHFPGETICSVCSSTKTQMANSQAGNRIPVWFFYIKGVPESGYVCRSCARRIRRYAS